VNNSSVKYFSLNALDTLIFPTTEYYDSTGNLIEITSDDYSVVFSMFHEAILTDNLSIDATAVDATSDATATIEHRYIDSTTYREIYTDNGTMYLDRDVSRYIASGTLALVDTELLFIYGCGEWDQDNNRLPVYVIRAWTDSTTISETITNEYYDGTTLVLTEYLVRYETIYDSIPTYHYAGASVKIFNVKDDPAEIENGKALYKWSNVPIAPVGRYRAEFTLSEVATDKTVVLPTARPCGSQRALIIDVRGY
jgi:hypothetical protein